MNNFTSGLTFTSLRYFFYAVTPSETTFARVEDVPDYTQLASSWFLVMVLIETVVLQLQGRDDAFALNDTLTSVNAGVLSAITKIGGRSLSYYLYLYLYAHCRLFDLPVDSQVTWFLAFLAQDFAYYLGHRAIHEAGVFWSFHQMHHSSEYYNFSTALRQGCIQDVGIALFDVLPSIAIPPPIFVVHKHLNVIYQYWIHTETIRSIGPLEYILNTPSHHRVHHGRNPYCIDKNYAGVLIIWDRIFGTFEPERKTERPVFGLVENARTFDQFYLQFAKFKELGWDKGRILDKEGKPLFPGFVNKIKAALWPPAYFPATKIKYFFLWFCMQDPEEGIPEVSAKEPKYNPPLSLLTKVYAMAQFVLLIAAYFTYASKHSASGFHHIACAVFVIATIQSIGYIFDRSNFSFRFEAVRLACSLAYGLLARDALFAAINLTSLALLRYVI